MFVKRKVSAGGEVLRFLPWVVSSLLVSCGSIDSFVFANSQPTTAPAEEGWCVLGADGTTMVPRGQVVTSIADAGIVIRVEPGEGITRPRVLHKTNPQFTSRASGQMQAKCLVTREGTLKDCCILKGRAGYNQALLAALRDWRYEPATFRGKPVIVTLVIPVAVEIH
jgi:TonB family protein